MLNQRIRSAYRETAQSILSAGGNVLAEGDDADDDSLSVAPLIVQVAAASFTSDLAEECFGPP